MFVYSQVSRRPAVSTSRSTSLLTSYATVLTGSVHILTLVPCTIPERHQLLHQQRDIHASDRACLAADPERSAHGPRTPAARVCVHPSGPLLHRDHDARDLSGPRCPASIPSARGKSTLPSSPSRVLDTDSNPFPPSPYSTRSPSSAAPAAPSTTTTTRSSATS